jgi:general secretion pathway protein K
LPIRTGVNLNTASGQVIYASLPDLDMAAALGVVTARDRRHFETLADANANLSNPKVQFNSTQHSVSSSFFEVRGRLRLDQTTVEERSLVQRMGQTSVVTVWRERGVSNR